MARSVRRHSYRDELERFEPDRVNDIFYGGAYGCPADYFPGSKGFDRETCLPLKEGRCRRCWGQPYQGEVYKPNDD